MVELVPLKLFSRRIAQGWTMVPGYPLEPGDYAVVMASPGSLSAADYPNNKSRGAASANTTRARRKAASSGPLSAVRQLPVVHS
jgi:hypothetical protein